MQITPILIVAFAIMANAQWWQHPGRYSYQQKGAANVVGSGTNGNAGSSNSGTNPNGGFVNGSDPISGSGSGTGTSTGTGTISNDLSQSVPVSGPQSSVSGTSTTNSGSTSSTSGDNAVGSTASFTQYTQDGGCSVASVACGWYSSSGYNAAISQATYGGGKGSGATAACGLCWRLTPDFPGANVIVVKVNNLCPADEHNPLCAQPAGEFFFFTYYALVLNVWGLLELGIVC